MVCGRVGGGGTVLGGRGSTVGRRLRTGQDDSRIAAICLMVTGMGFVAIVTAAAAERFVRNRRREFRPMIQSVG
jgi:hypothetical protein